MLRAELRDTPTEDTPAPPLDSLCRSRLVPHNFFFKKIKSENGFLCFASRSSFALSFQVFLLVFGTIEKISYLCSTNLICLCTCYIKVRAVGRLPFLLSIVEEQARERERAKTRIVFFILSVVQTLPLICLFCLLSFGTIEKIAYLCSVESSSKFCCENCNRVGRAVGRLLFSFIRCRGTSQRAEPTPPPKHEQSK